MTIDAYRELRHFLLVRLALGGGLLIVVGAVALTWVPGAPTPDTAKIPSTTSVAKGRLPVADEKSNASTAGGVPLAANSQDLLDKPRLEDAMRPLAVPEPLEGKSFEVLPKTGGTEVGSPSSGPVDDKTEAPAKLPKGPHLQAGIFAQAANAEEFRRKLNAAGYPAYVESRVHVGPYPNRKEAERVREKLKAEGTTTVYVPQ